MNKNIGYLTIILFVGTFIGLGLNPYIDTPLNPTKEITTTTTSYIPITLPQITSTSSTTLTETSTSTSIIPTTLTSTSIITATSTTTLPKETTTYTTTNTVTTTNSTTLTSTITSLSTATVTSTTSSIITSTTTVVGDDVWEKFRMRIKEPQNIDSYSLDVDSSNYWGSVAWWWDNDNALYIIWYQASEPEFLEDFELAKTSDGVNNPQVIDRGQITIDSHVWEYETISYTDNNGGKIYSVSMSGFYSTKGMGYWIMFDSPNSNVLDEMKIYTDTFELLELNY